MSSEHKVWVGAEYCQGELAKVSLGLLSKAHELCGQLGGGEVVAVLLGTAEQKVAQELIDHGADKAYLAENSSLTPFQTDLCADFVVGLVRDCQPEMFLWGATNLSSEIAARVAAKLGTGLTAHCIDLYVEEIENIKQLVAVVAGYGGNLTIKIICPRKRPQMATVKSGIFASLKSQTRDGEVVRVEVGGMESRIGIVEIVEEQEKLVVLEQAEVVVAGGWGMSCFGNFKLAEELAQALGGMVGGTRPAVDAGWIPHEQMIGQSGVTVAPRLLVTLGVSGAAQFATTVTGSKFILAIDKNPNAPIFEMADLGIVGDLQEVLPLLIGKIGEVKRE